ncbi:MAG: hypothetical protein IJQ80_07240, partial [Clostridia bacterium]|nr:hypothetical protein [Clostridia bacterium]
MKRVLSFFLATLFITSFISSIGINAGQDNLPKETNITFAGGDGSQSNPYQVSTPEQLNAVRNDLSAHYVQINDIDMSTWGNWEPIGHAISSFGATHSFSDYSNEYFTGSYLGNNYKISN